MIIILTYRPLYINQILTLITRQKGILGHLLVTNFILQDKDMLIVIHLRHIVMVGIIIIILHQIVDRVFLHIFPCQPHLSLLSTTQITTVHTIQMLITTIHIIIVRIIIMLIL